MYKVNNRAVELSKAGKLDESIALFEEALKVAPNDSKINFNIALVYIKKEQFDRAATYLEQSVVLSPCDDNLREIGVCYIRLKEFDKAKQYLVRAITEFGSSESQNVLGVMFFQISNFEEAKKHFENATKLNSKNSDAWFNLKDTCLQLGLERDAKIAQYQFELLVES